jgi:uncharacterized protein YicC (UPF0701 family)
MKIRVIVFDNTGIQQFEKPHEIMRVVMDMKAVIYRLYDMDHNDPAQRRVLGEQCRNAFEAGQCLLTYPVAA